MPTQPLVPRDPTVVALTDALAAPFEPREVKFKPQAVKNNRCLAMAYIDARLVQERLDDVLGAENWEDIYKQLPDGSVMCKLRIKLGDRWITKMDVGSPSEQPDQGDRLKAAVSDALKRAAVKYGIGRYLYRLAAQWVDYDPVKKQIVQAPQLPTFAQPKRP
ncbi:MAG: Rad52/Rad22 family DNA repair protein, partial [Gemmata sp.]